MLGGGYLGLADEWLIATMTLQPSRGLLWSFESSQMLSPHPELYGMAGAG